MFYRAEFSGHAEFAERTGFDGAKFAREARFDAKFAGPVVFRGATFAGRRDFAGLVRVDVDGERLWPDGWELGGNPAMRLRPVIQSVARKLTEPVEIAGYGLSAGTVVSPSISLVHHDATLHDEPDTFRPDRFIGKPPEPGTWIPFGGGARRCISAGFSLQEAVAVLKATLTRYDLSPATARPEYPKPRNITLVPSRGARIIATPR